MLIAISPATPPYAGEVPLAPSRPRSRHAHWQKLGHHNQLFVVNGSRVYDADDEVISRLEAAVSLGESAVEQVLERLGLMLPPVIDDTPVTSPPLRAISL